MFQKPAFGANTSGFGSFSATTNTSSPFGFKPAAGTSAFGAAPAFGAAATNQPATTGGLFGTQPATTGGLFGASASAPAPAFGAQSSTFGSTFGSPAPASTGLFGGGQTGGGLFGGAQSGTAFGAKPAGFGFGTTPANNTSGGGLFGATQPATGGLFGQNTNTLSGGGLFGSNTTSSFGQQPVPTGTGHVMYNPVTGSDMVIKNGTSQSVNVKHICITCMKEYENKCLEELRLEDYMAGRKGPSQTGFGGFQATENKPLFGGAGGFGQPATTSAPGVFGGGGLNTSTFGQSNTFAFGGANQTNTQTTSLFGANKPTFGATSTAGTGLFGTTTTTQAAPAFGTNTNTFGFGANTSQPSTGLFGAKPTTATSGFGSFGSTGVFGAAKPQTAAAPAFGSNPLGGFGSTPLGGFGTSTANTGGLFGGGTFGKPNTSQPTFGLTQTPALGAGLGANPLQAKPTGFGTLGGTMFQPTQNNNSFNTGLSTGLMSNQPTLGGAFGGLGGLNTNTVNGPGSTSNVGIHEQILTAVARPYGGHGLFKDLLPDTSTTAEDILKPTNPAAVKAALDKSQYRLTSPAQTLNLKPRAHCDKKSLFDGLEEADSTLEDKLSLKPSRKRLVLRPNNSVNRENSDPLVDNRSLEEQRQNSLNSPQERDLDIQENALDKDRHVAIEKDERRPFSENNHFDSNSDRHGSWLSSPPQQMWNSKEKQQDIEPTPRIYPQLDKELPNQVSERRASWLTTKPLRKPLNSVIDTESSVRELIRNDIQREQEIQHTRERSIDASPDRLSLSEEEHVPPRDSPPHPAGVKLTRPGYYTIPSLEHMINFIRPDGRCVVPNLTIGRKNYGNVYFDCEIDVTGLDLDTLVHFLNKEVIIYPEDADKPPVGEGLNRRAIVTLDRIWPRDKTDKRTITSPERLLKMDYEGKLRRVCDKHDTKFIEYRPLTGSWVFRVEHFSKYGLTDSDEEDDITPEVMKRQIAHQQLQKAAPIPPKPPLQSTGLGGLASIPLSTTSLTSPAISGMQIQDDGIFSSSLNVLNGSGKGFEMDTTENTELQSMYTDMDNVFGVKSPTSELAKLENRHPHNVQLMKASLYLDTEMDDDDVTSVSTHDQQVPNMVLAPNIHEHARPGSLQSSRVDILPAEDNVVEQPMKALIVQPQTVILKYHRKVPPFKQTVAGRLDAKFLADFHICRSRHSRVGFGPDSTLAYVTSYDSVADLPKNAELCDIKDYLSGRSENDWSGQVVNTLKISDPNIQETLSNHIEALLEHSTYVSRQNSSALYTVEDKLGLLRKHVEIASKCNVETKFGVSSSYCLEVWKLCEALWGADLENGGIPGTDDHSIVHRYRQFIKWINQAVSTITDKQLAEAKTADEQDDGDFHSARIWTLLLGGRITEACHVAAKNGDLNMCAIIAQGGGDPNFRSLLTRQLSTWLDCGASTLISTYRLATLQLLSGATPNMICDVPWLCALSGTTRYLCHQIPSLEQIILKYESLFQDKESQDMLDITTVEDELMQFPSPPHEDEYCVSVQGEAKPRKILDLRYELIRARAFNTRPKLQPASYTPDPLDYSLCFLLGTWLGVGVVSDEICSSFASQLEQSGAWHLAAAALCYMPGDQLRSHLIRGVLSRNAPSKAETASDRQKLDLIQRLAIPSEWLTVAQAHRAKYEHLPLIEAQHLVSAQQWDAAHKVLMEHLFADAVLGDNLKSLLPLLDKLNEAAEQSLVPGWESGGKALYHYSVLCHEILGVVNEIPDEVDVKIQALRPHVIATCNSLALLKPTNMGVAAARAEVAARALQLAAAAGGAGGARPPPRKVPPGTAAQMLSQLCERAQHMSAVQCNDNAATPLRI